MNPLALEALTKGQRQIDQDGVEVGVSRQALDELIVAYAEEKAKATRLEAERDEARADWRNCVAELATALSRAERAEASAAQMEAALRLVRGIIVEAAWTGFNCHSGNWATRLFESQAVTHAALPPAPDADLNAGDS